MLDHPIFASSIVHKKPEQIVPPDRFVLWLYACSELLLNVVHEHLLYDVCWRRLCTRFFPYFMELQALDFVLTDS